MPQVDVQWPSEDEDFDAKADTNSSKTAVKTKPSITKVTDEPTPVEKDQPTEDQDTANHEEVPVEPTSPTAAEKTESESTESTSEEAANQPDSDPAVQNEAATIANAVDEPLPPDTKLPTAGSFRRSAANMGVWRLAAEGVLVVAVIVLGAWSWSLYNDRKDLQGQVKTLNANPQSVVQKQTQQLITRVGHLITLPASETPTVAEVSNAAQAKQQSSFFANAQNGDRVLMYVKAGEAILYRPSTNKIILVAPLVFTNNSSSTSSSTNKATTSTPSTTSTTKGTTTTSTPNTAAKP